MFYKISFLQYFSKFTKIQLRLTSSLGKIKSQISMGFVFSTFSLHSLLEKFKKYKKKTNMLHKIQSKTFVSGPLFVSVFFKIYFYTIFFNKPPRKYLNFTIKENMRGKHAKDETFRHAFSRVLVTGNLKLNLGACQEELFHLDLRKNYSRKNYSILISDKIFRTSLFENYS